MVKQIRPVFFVLLRVASWEKHFLEMCIKLFGPLAPH
jgi:hypothetical protein